MIAVSRWEPAHGCQDTAAWIGIARFPCLLDGLYALMILSKVFFGHSRNCVYVCGGEFNHV